MPNFPQSDALIQEIRAEFPLFRVVPKSEHRLQRAIGWALRIVTFGAQHEYLSRYHTVLGYTLYVPHSWPSGTDASRFILLRHERVHLRQRRRYGMLGMALLYMIPFFPLGLAYGRARIEWEAYAETLRATAEVHGLDAMRDPALHAYLVKQFTSGAYGWMWPFPYAIRRWIAEAMAVIEREQREQREHPHSPGDRSSRSPSRRS
ncbi:MAG: hypothetical protein NVS3B20_10000 [Polyangiales bacterium]